MSAVFPTRFRDLKWSVLPAFCAVLIASGCGVPFHALSDTQLDEAVDAGQQVCGAGRAGQRYRDPATLRCVTSPPSGQQTNFYVFELLYTRFASRAEPLRTRIEFREPLSWDALNRSFSDLPAPAVVNVGLYFAGTQNGLSIPVRLESKDVFSREVLRYALNRRLEGFNDPLEERNEIMRAFDADQFSVRQIIVLAPALVLTDYWHRNAAVVRYLFPELPANEWPHLQGI